VSTSTEGRTDATPAGAATADDAKWIDIAGLDKIYQARRSEPTHALSDITFSVRRSEFISLVGPSGCGKTTLLKILAGLVGRSSGEVSIAGTDVTRPLPQVGMVFQAPTLLPWRTVLKNVMVPVEVQGLDKDRYRERARELLDMVGLGEFEDSYPYELSGGMQQRAGICRALVHGPAVLLMDEPFGALDAMTREKMNVELMRIQRETGKTVLLITHSIPEAVFLADRVLVMTERPGAIAAIYDVPLPRPRSLDAMADPAFTELVQRIRKHFFTQSALD
jgi:NitT/TauT family transport system ATP-binding protein